MSTPKHAPHEGKLAQNPQKPSGMNKYKDHWRQQQLKGDKVDLFDSREPIGVGHMKLWKFLMTERRLWRRYLSRAYGFDVRTGRFTQIKRVSGGYPSIPFLETSPIEKTESGQDVLNRWSRRLQCLRHPFYQALAQYLAVCDCQDLCGDPLEFLANPHFTTYSERRAVLTIHAQEHVKSSLLREIGDSAIVPRETWGEYLARPRRTFRCRSARGAFNAVYLPVKKILEPECGPDGDTGDFYGAFADNGISLRVDSRLKAVLKDGGADPYERKCQLIPGVVLNKVLPDLWKIADPNEREAEFYKLPGKTAYALGKILGVTRRRNQPLTVELEEISGRTPRKVDDRVAREQVNERDMKAATAILEKLPERQRTVYRLNRIEKLTLKEIAEYLNISPGTAASHLGRANKRIDELKQEKK